jgi:iron(III) transport system permease protein
MEMAARSLGRSPGGTLRAIHLPLARGSVMTAGIIVCVDAATELPATLILRPFDFDTLATLTHIQASLESLGGAAPPALAIVVLGLLPAMLLRRTEQPR